MAGPQASYAFLERKDSNNKNFLIIGPWKHGIWAGGYGDQLGSIKFGQRTAFIFGKNSGTLVCLPLKGNRRWQLS
jgi:hypothetical protein